jgi:enolase-phosphatase E1
MTTPSPAIVLLDIEGTTTPIDFVFKTLFPYARERMGDYLRLHAGDAEVEADVAAAWDEYRKTSPSNNPPVWSDQSDLAQAADYLRWLIDRDVKSPALKSLQGKIWQQGYDDGSLKGEVYADVPVAIQRWRAEGRRVAIYSSGSVLAQRLLFRTTAHGDLSQQIDAHFDTAVGPKRDPDSYLRIANALGTAPSEILFVSDIIAELDAAHQVAMQTALSVRPGMVDPPPQCPHHVARDLNQALPGAA